MGKGIQAELGRVPTAKRWSEIQWSETDWSKSRSESFGQSNRMLAGMQRQDGARRYSRVKRAVEKLKSMLEKYFAF